MITGMPRIAIATRDFDACVTTFRDRLGFPVHDISESSVESLGAKLAMCVPTGGSNIELMSPADPEAPLSESLERFLARRGEGLFALMLEAPDPDTEAEGLTRRGLNVLPLMPGAGGRDIHPNSTNGVLIRVYPTNSFQAEPPPANPADAGLSGIVRVIIAVRDLDQARATYGEGLGLATDEPLTDPQRGVRAVTCRPPAGGVIELVEAVDPGQPFAGRIHDFINNDREGMFALVLETTNRAESKSTLTRHGVAVRASIDAPDTLEIDPETTFGARLRIQAA